MLKTVLRIRIRDPVPLGPLDPGSRIGFFRIPDPTITSESLKQIFLGLQFFNFVPIFLKNVLFTWEQVVLTYWVYV